MKKGIVKPSGKLRINKSYEGEPLERKLAKIMETKEPIPADAPIIYTERKEGTLAEYNIRTDRFDLALEGMDKISKGFIARRESIGEKTEKNSGETPVNTSDQ